MFDRNFLEKQKALHDKQRLLGFDSSNKMILIPKIYKLPPQKNIKRRWPKKLNPTVKHFHLHQQR
jgi:hypothetical protein